MLAMQQIIENSFAIFRGALILNQKKSILFEKFRNKIETFCFIRSDAIQLNGIAIAGKCR